MTAPRRRRPVVATAALAVVALALATQAAAPTDASWNDAEWGRAAAGASSCGGDADPFAARAEGRALGGSLLGVDLDALAQAAPVVVTNDGSRSKASAGAVAAGLPDSYRDPLAAEALGTVAADLDGVLQLPLDNSTGVVGQFAQAEGDGHAVGAGGYVTDSGGIALADEQTEEYPDLASLDLSALLGSLGLGLGTAVSDVSDLRLDVGAVTGRADLSVCDALWNLSDATADDIVSGLKREYLTAAADLTFESDAVGTLVTAVGGSPDEACGAASLSVVRSLECAVNGISGDRGVLDGVLGAVTGIVGTLTNGLGLGSVDATVTARIDLSAVDDLLTQTLEDDDRLVSVDLSSGVVRIDAAALLATVHADEGGGERGALAPNTNLLGDAAVLSALSAALSSALEDWIASVADALRSAVAGITFTVAATINLTLTLIGKIDIGNIAVAADCRPTGSASPGPGCTIADLQNPPSGVKVTTASLQLLPGIPLLGAVVSGILNGLVGSLESLLGTKILPTLLGAVGAVTTDVLEPIVSTTLPALVVPLETLTSALYDALDLDGLLSVTFNAQNRTPDPDDVEPPEWTGMGDGRYHVAALRIGILDAAGDARAALRLGEASVGPGCSMARAPSDCPDY